jgi:lipopolysaccharide export system protein LptC
MDQLTATPAFDEREARHHAAGRRGDGARRFDAAVRHSRTVRILRIAVPAGALLLVAGSVLATYLNPLRNLLPRDAGRVVVSGTKITMEQPKLAGFTKDSRAYNFTARAAAQDITKPDLLELKDINATVDMQDGQVRITSPEGVYNSKTEVLNLLRDIVLISSNYECRLIEATVEVRSGKVMSDKPVDVKFSNGTLVSNGIEVLESGALIRFTGGVVMNAVMSDSDRPGQKAASAR